MAKRQCVLVIALASALVSLSCGRSAPAPEVDDRAATPETPRSGEPADDRLRVLEDDELTPAIIHAARQILDEYAGQKLGHEVPFELGGKRYVGRLEEHYHPPGSGQQPVGEHVGVTVYAVEPAGRTP